MICFLFTESLRQTLCDGHHFLRKKYTYSYKRYSIDYIYRSSDLMMVLNSRLSWEYVVYPCLSPYSISTCNHQSNHHIFSYIKLYLTYCYLPDDTIFFVCVCVLYIPTGTMVWNSANCPNVCSFDPMVLEKEGISDTESQDTPRCRLPTRINYVYVSMFCFHRALQPRCRGQ